jgi:hypothetical protein
MKKKNQVKNYQKRSRRSFRNRRLIRIRCALFALAVQFSRSTKFFVVKIIIIKMKSFTPQGGADQPLGKREINCRAALINDPSTQSVCQPAGVI